MKDTLAESDMSITPTLVEYVAFVSVIKKSVTPSLMRDSTRAPAWKDIFIFTKTVILTKFYRELETKENKTNIIECGLAHGLRCIDNDDNVQPDVVVRPAGGSSGAVNAATAIRIGGR